MSDRTLALVSRLLSDLYRLQQPADVLRVVDRWARRLAPCDLVVPALTDRPSGTVALQGVPRDFAEGYVRHAAEDLTRLAHLAPAHTGAVRLSEVLPARDLRRSGIYNEVLRPHRIRHVMTTCLVENPRVTGVLKMIRLDAGPDFSDRERDALALAAPHVRVAYANAEALADLARQARRFHLVCDRLGVAALVADARGALLYASAEGQALCQRYFRAVRRGPAGRAALPAALAALLAPLRPRATFEGPSGGRLLVRVARLDQAGEALLLLDEIEAPSPAALSAREREVLRWVSEGKTNPEIGVILGISARTVQTHLEHVFAKLGVVSRAQAVAEALRRGGGGVAP
jgi:DNA-binding CsgD family transcriptional regulator